jgi:hypothetical protein
MKQLSVVVGIAALVASGMSNAEGIGLRVGLESPLYAHADQNGQSVSFSIGDTFKPAIDVLLEYYMNSFVALGLEGREGFLATGSNPTVSGCIGGICKYQRTGSYLGPNLTFDLAPIPIFLRAGIPFHIEPSPFHLDFRAAGGLKIGVPFISFYAEVLADFPLAGSGVDAFSSQSFGLGIGVWLKL